MSDSGRRTAPYAAQKLAIDRRQRFPQFAGCCFIPCANVNANNLALCLHQAPTEPTACCLCFLPMTITHRIETLTPPLFFGCYLHASGHLGIFLVFSAGLSTQIFGKNWQWLRQKPIQSRFQLFDFRIDIAFFSGSGNALS